MFVKLAQGILKVTHSVEISHLNEIEREEDRLGDSPLEGL